MASKGQRTSRSRSRRGNSGMMFGVMLGLVLGLMVAATVAYVITQKPTPFADRASRTPQTPRPDARHIPDPNKALAGNNTPTNTPAAIPGIGVKPVTRPALPSTDTSPASGLPNPARPQSNDIAALLATLDKAQSVNQAETIAVPLPDSPSNAPNHTPVNLPNNTSGHNHPSRQTSTIYFLQAGAFRSEQDAQSRRAQVLLLGLPAQVQTAKLDGSPLYRVRVGPFRGIDEMNRSRIQLSQAKIDSAVVRP